MTTKKERQEGFSRNEKKWTVALMDAGYTVLPSIILEKQAALGLDAIDINILLHLATYWWYSDNPAHPTKGRIARAMGVDASTVRRRIARLEKDELIQREKRFNPKTRGQLGNFYHFGGLIKACKPFAEEVVRIRAQRTREDDQRRSRKRPALPVGAEANDNQT
jgi:helix-turn-helix protein